MDEQSLTKFFAQFLEVPDCKVDVFMFRTAERALQGVNVTMPEFFAENCSAGAFLFLHIEEAAVFEGESLEYFAHKERELLAVPGVVDVMAAVNKCIFLHGMTVQVAKKHHLSDFLDAHDQFFEVENF